MISDRLEAIGPRGEACIIVRTPHDAADADPPYRYSLAAGDRLQPTDAVGEFVTLGGRRRFRLRAMSTTPDRPVSVTAIGTGAAS